MSLMLTCSHSKENVLSKMAENAMSSQEERRDRTGVAGDGGRGELISHSDGRQS